jgi:hypothetical protein
VATTHEKEEGNCNQRQRVELKIPITAGKKTLELEFNGINERTVKG